MNIFILDRDPRIAARMLCDKHIVKMIIESAQILCTVGRQNGFDTPYRSTHVKHPCTIWAGDSKSNWDWLIEHSLEMCAEYTRRYGKVHRTLSVIEWCKDNPIGPKFDKGLTPFPLAMPAAFKTHDAVESYRNYYLGAKAKFAKWKTGAPSWWNDVSNNKMLESKQG